MGRCSGISYTYRDQAQQRGAPTPGPAIGDRAPDVDLGRGRTLFDLTRHPSCTLLALPAHESGQAALQASLESARASLRIRRSSCASCRRRRRSPQRYGASDEDRLLLLRPDGYVGYRCNASELAALEMRLHEWFAL